MLCKRLLIEQRHPVQWWAPHLHWAELCAYGDGVHAREVVAEI